MHSWYVSFCSLSWRCLGHDKHILENIYDIITDEPHKPSGSPVSLKYVKYLRKE